MTRAKGGGRRPVVCGRRGHRDGAGRPGGGPRALPRPTPLRLAVANEVALVL